MYREIGKMKEWLRFTILENEYWWGGAVNCGYLMPIGKDSDCCIDLNGTPGSDQYAPLFVSSKGRYLWSERSFILRAQKGQIVCEGEAEVVLEAGHGSLRGAYLAACAAHFPFSPRMPDKRFFSQPQYNTWIELATEQTSAAILRYARSILAHGMPAGILMIDEGWQEDYGVFEFNRRKIPNPRVLIDKLHAMGFSVMLWVTPITSCDGPQFLHRQRKGWLIRDRSGRIALREWWNGTSAMLDLTNPEVVAWYHEQLRSLSERYGVDGFKFDSGDAYFYRDDDLVFQPTSAREQTRLFNRIGERYPLNEFRAAWNFGGHPIVARLQDKNHSWENFGINALIPHTIVQGLLGYAYCCPDMVGGGCIDSFGEGRPLDEELFVRWAQANALMGMLQMSISPWRVLKKENAALVVEAMQLHTAMGERIYALAQHAARTGEPIVRHMAYEFPDEGLETVQGQFMLGSELLAAPVIEKGASHKTVILPKGRWQSWQGQCYDGGTELTLPVTLRDIPHFFRMG